MRRRRRRKPGLMIEEDGELEVRMGSDMFASLEHAIPQPSRYSTSSRARSKGARNTAMLIVLCMAGDFWSQASRLSYYRTPCVVGIAAFWLTCASPSPHLPSTFRRLTCTFTSLLSPLITIRRPTQTSMTITSWRSPRPRSPRPRPRPPRPR